MTTYIRKEPDCHITFFRPFAAPVFSFGAKKCFLSLNLTDPFFGVQVYVKEEFFWTILKTKIFKVPKTRRPVPQPSPTREQKVRLRLKTIL